MKEFKEQFSDLWCTPDWLFDELNQEFYFDIDLCANRDNTKCNMYCTDYLRDICIGKYDLAQSQNLQLLIKNRYTDCFMNPPYSNPFPFIEKAWNDSRYCKIVCLLKCDTSTKWWGLFWDYELHCPKDGCKVRFFPKRIKFEDPNIKRFGNGYKVLCNDLTGVSIRNTYMRNRIPCIGKNCKRCKGTGYRYKNKAGASFPTCLVIMDRRGL